MLMSSKWSTKLYSILMPFLPILILYGFEALPFLTFSDYILIFFVVVNIIENRFKLICKKYFSFLIMYLIIEPLVLLIISPQNVDFIDAAGTAWKLALYILGVSLLAKDLLKDILVKSIRFIGVASTFYGFFQFVFGTYLHISLSPYLPFLPVLRVGLDTQQEGWISYNWVVRPRAWFSEPSTFAIFLLLALLIELFVVSEKDRKKKLSFLYAFGIIISRSSTGVFALVILAGVWMILNPEDFWYKIPRKTIVAFLILLPVCGLFLYKGGYIESFASHTFVNGQGLMAQSHFSDISEAFKRDSNILTILFGNGMQEVAAGYLPGWFRVYYCLGITGIVLYIFEFYKIFRVSKKHGRIIVLTFVFLNFGTEIMLGVFLLLYMSVAILPEDSKEKKKNGKRYSRYFNLKNNKI